ncbi:sensor histidine kinase [Ekhidna sp.]|uniref:sensor histidine kinase n=1 Tax=Ekhidna sp. TaxID=2608089 RepID=UPI003BACBD13
MKNLKYLKREQGFYLFLMISAYVSTLVFSAFYYVANAPEIYIPTFGAFILFAIYGVLSFFSVGLVTLFRLSILTALVAFFNQVYYTGGITSSALVEFLIPPLLAFFYRPISDRYIFMIMSAICMLIMYPLSVNGYTVNLVPDSLMSLHGVFCSVFVFAIVSIYTFLFRNALVIKNQQIGDSMKKLQDTTHKLIQSEKMASLGVLSAGVAHEINNPLNFIKGGVEILEAGIKEDEKLKFETSQSINVIKEGLNRATIIVNSLNHFSRNTESMTEKCDIHEIIENSLIMLQPKLKYKGNVVKDFAKDALVITGNEGKLHQAFLNIIANAEQAIEKNGNITVRTIKSGKMITVEVEDDGEGISKENLKKISDPFFTTKPVGKGTGLGLSITYKIIEDHSGSIMVSSKKGKGSKFVISFNQT